MEQNKAKDGEKVYRMLFFFYLLLVFWDLTSILIESWASTYLLPHLVQLKSDRLIWIISKLFQNQMHHGTER